MGVLHDELNRLMRELCADVAVKAEVVRNIFARRGISLTEPEFEILVKAIDESRDSDTIEVPIDRLTGTLDIGSDEIEQALLEWAVQGPVAADASDEVIASIFGGDSDEGDESIESALADEVFAL